MALSGFTERCINAETRLSEGAALNCLVLICCFLGSGLFVKVVCLSSCVGVEAYRNGAPPKLTVIRPR